jgi:hypothetical protein
MPDVETSRSTLTKVSAHVDDVERVILAGDHIRVKVGRHAGVVGITSEVDGDNVSLIQKDTNDIVRTL